MNNNSNGRLWARGWLVAALFVSIVANITHTVLADSSIHLALRVPGAIVWPLFTFAGIEIVVRMIWERRFTHSFARVVLLAAAVPAAITSYEHQYSLLGLMGERQLIQVIGPLAVDGLMIGCTMALLFTRDVPAALSLPVIASAREDTEDLGREADAILARYEEEMREILEDIPDDALAMNDELDNPVPIPDPSSPTRPLLRIHATSAQQEEAIRFALEGMRAKEIAPKVGAGLSTVARWTRVVGMIIRDPSIEIDCAKERVTPAFVAYVKEKVQS